VVNFTPRPRCKSLGTHWIGDWVSPRVGLDAVTKGNSPGPAGNRTPIVQPVALSLF